MNSPINGIEVWLAVEQATPGRTVQDALDDLNRACGRRYTYSHLSRWRRGLEQPGMEVVRYMARTAGQQSVRETLGITISTEELDALLRYLLPPEMPTPPPAQPEWAPEPEDVTDIEDDLDGVLIGRRPDFERPQDP